MDQLLVILNILAACNDVLLKRVDAFLVLDHLLEVRKGGGRTHWHLEDFARQHVYQYIPTSLTTGI
jgi:hypothetical protein